MLPTKFIIKLKRIISLAVGDSANAMPQLPNILLWKPLTKLDPRPGSLKEKDRYPRRRHPSKRKGGPTKTAVSMAHAHSLHHADPPELRFQLSPDREIPCLKREPGERPANGERASRYCGTAARQKLTRSGSNEWHGAASHGRPFARCVLSLCRLCLHIFVFVSLCLWGQSMQLEPLNVCAK